jgi:energy-coupling factor transport system permease protein
MQALSAKTRLHTITQLLVLAAASAMALTITQPLALLVLAFFTAVYAFTRVNASTLMKIYLVLFVLNAIMLLFIRLLAQFIPNYPVSSLLNQSIPFLRIFISMSATVAIALSAPIDELFNNLKMLKLPQVIVLPLSVAIRFIPTFMDDIKQLRDINYVRFDGLHPALWGLRPITLWRSFCVPLVFRTFHSCEALSVAAELKGVGHTKRETVKKPLLKNDVIVLLLTALAMAAAVFIEYKLGPVPSMHGGRRG